MTTTFEPWLRALEGAGKGPFTCTIFRGQPFAFSWTVTGDYTGATYKGSLRLQPDAAGATLVDFTTAALVIAGGQTTFKISLTKAQTAALPADGEGDGVVELATTILWTRSGVPEEMLMGGTALVLGKVTDAS